MNVVLMGYMASGKSTIGKNLARITEFEFLDLDAYIEEKEQNSISHIFKTKGEIYFRKLESQYLKDLLRTKDKLVLSLGGGTPCYGENMQRILNDENVTSIYLKASLKTLVSRLEHEKSTRPIISHLISEAELTEFIAKHLFERRAFYEKSEYTVVTDSKTVPDIVEELVPLLN